MYFPENLQEFPNFDQLKSFAGSPFTKLYDIALRAVLPEMFQRSTSDYSNFASERYAASASVTCQLKGNILPVVALNFDLPTPGSSN